MDNAVFDDITFMEQFNQAQEAAQVSNLIEPRAIAAFYDESSNLVVIRLKSGSIFSFPPDIAQGLAGATAKDLASIEITFSGDALYWENLDADFSVPDLLMGIFGSKKWMAKLQEEWSKTQAS
jgi:hypothetical protein